MMKLIRNSLLFVILTSSAYSRSSYESIAASFINALIKNSGDLEKFVLPSELKLSKRLGIVFPDIKHKFLISNDIDSSIRIDLNKKRLKYKYHIEIMDEGYWRLIFEVPSMNMKNSYYFYKSFLISKPAYYAKDWPERDSRYFKFHISDPHLINQYSIDRLDSFIDASLDLLECTEAERERLEKGKIHYFLCGDQNEIELLTGYKARGMYYLPYDYIVSTFNCHYHELMHLLINFKLKSNRLYTLPFLQEGFAVAFGGRGGKEPDVIMEMGLFLAQSNMVNYKSLLDRADFYQFDASLSYPISGLYIKFLIEMRGIKSFVELYKKYSCGVSKINQLKIDSGELPGDTEWLEYVHKKGETGSIRVSGIEETDFPTLIVKAEDYSIHENKDEYLFMIKDNMEIFSETTCLSYESKLFKQLFPGKDYKIQMYLLAADSNEVSVYNLFTNNLIAKYVTAFTMGNEPVNQKGGLYIFTVQKRVFDEPIKKGPFDRMD